MSFFTGIVEKLMNTMKKFNDYSFFFLNRKIRKMCEADIFSLSKIFFVFNKHNMKKILK